ncbi:MAG TPA: sulfatase [Candidatus Glassbacteria bacterium]|nr:sulfatase [Candidatus Glassbacteria bacterium]
MALAGCQKDRLDTTAGPAETRKPNFIVVFTDDQGYADTGKFGAKGFATPNLDRLADQGVRFTDFHAATAVCSASRAGLLTGCYPERVSILGALGPHSPVGISDEEVTIAQMLKTQGYATGCIGKWHLGDSPQFLPTRHGFDYYFGLPYSHDMWPHHPENPQGYPPLPLISGEKTIAHIEDASYLTTWYTDRAVDFIERNAGRPFFLYLAHNLPHVPLFVSDKFRGKTERGLYGDVIAEIDWSVGRIVETLKKLGLDQDTLVIFTSDNGPWLSYGDHAGSAGPLREGKGTMFEGGMREPCIMSWPGQVPTGRVCTELATTLDLFPTFAGLAGGSLPQHRIDGHDIWPLITGEPGAKSPWECWYCYYLGGLIAVRTPEWKLVFPHSYRTLDGQPGGTGGLPVKYSQKDIGLSLYDMVNDYAETTDVSGSHPEVVEKLKAYGDRARADLGDRLTGAVGSGIREPGRVATTG